MFHDRIVSCLAHLVNPRRDLMQELIRAGVSQAEIARQLGVSRQAIQK
jgi:IS30 family transposase